MKALYPPNLKTARTKHAISAEPGVSASARSTNFAQQPNRKHSPARRRSRNLSSFGSGVIDGLLNSCGMPRVWARNARQNKPARSFAVLGLHWLPELPLLRRVRTPSASPRPTGGGTRSSSPPSYPCNAEKCCPRNRRQTAEADISVPPRPRRRDDQNPRSHSRLE